MYFYIVIVMWKAADEVYGSKKIFCFLSLNDFVILFLWIFIVVRLFRINMKYEALSA